MGYETYIKNELKKYNTKNMSNFEKKIIQKIRNRMSAQRSRMRNKNKMISFQKENQILKNQNNILLNQLKIFQSQNLLLKSKLNNYQNYNNNNNNNSIDFDNNFDNMNYDNIDYNNIENDNKEIEYDIDNVDE